MAAGIGSLVELGMGSWTGLNTHGIALGALPLPAFARPDITDFLWTIPLAVAIAVGTFVIFRLGLRVEGIVTRRRVVLTTVAGLIIAGLAIAFSEATDHSVNEVLFSGQDALPGLVTHAGAYSLGALALLVAFKGLAYGLSLGSFRGGPIFPAMFLGRRRGNHGLPPPRLRVDARGLGRHRRGRRGGAAPTPGGGRSRRCLDLAIGARRQGP